MDDNIFKNFNDDLMFYSEGVISEVKINTRGAE
jgi:hypothetical protein